MSKKVFTADVAQLLKLVTHSIYSNKEIFLRELIANANDALQKAKILAAGDANYLGDQVDLQITIATDKDAKTITITDTGIGMTVQDVEKHIGTIAQSGTKSFLEKMKDMKDVDNNLVGQFGIGFYSAFMVADRVEIYTKSNDSEKWVHRSSTGDDAYEIEEVEKSDRWTTITLHLTEENKEFLESYRLRSLIRTYADYIPVPIMMPKEVKDADKKEESESSNEREQVNTMTALWQKNKKDVTPEEYKKHYQSLAMSMDEPLDVIHLNVEWNINYKAILYIPKTANPFQDINDPSKEYGPALYVQNVMIMKNTKELLPPWLRHIVGVVQTPDLPLNVSREILQQSAIMAKIQSSLIKEVIKSLAYSKKENNADYREHYKHFSRLLKEWVYYDHERREELAWLLYFAHTSPSAEQSSLSREGDHEVVVGLWQTITLDDYITQNTESLKGLKHIYYLHTPSAKEWMTNPHIHKCQIRGLDVLLMTDPIDEYMLSMLRTYKEYEFANIASSDIKLPEHKEEWEQKKKVEKAEKKHKDFLGFVTSTIGEEKLEKVSFGHDLGESIAVLQAGEWQPSAQMIKMYKAMGQDIPAIKKSLLINPNHPLVEQYMSTYENNKDDAKIATFISYLYDQALLAEWSDIESMSAFIQRVNNLLK